MCQNNLSFYYSFAGIISLLLSRLKIIEIEHLNNSLSIVSFLIQNFDNLWNCDI